MTYSLLWLVGKFIEAGSGPLCTTSDERRARMKALGLPDDAVNMRWWRTELERSLNAYKKARVSDAVAADTAAVAAARRELAEAQKKIESLQNSLAALAFAEEEIRALRDDPKVMPRGRKLTIECDSGWDD